MARTIILYSDQDEKILKYWNTDIDICNSHTIIHRPHETIRLVAEIEAISMKNNKTVVFYKNGCYIVINRQ